MIVRRIEERDDAAIASIIRENLKKFGLDIPGTAYFDPELDHLSAYYKAREGHATYFIATDEEGRVIGGVGACAFSEMEDCVELQKLYLVEEVKGKGYGRKLLELIEDWAKEKGYRQAYLETHSNLDIALKLYETSGYELIAKPDFVVHTTMDHFYLKQL